MPKQVLSDLDFNSVARVINLPAPTAGHHAANRDYVDSAVEGLAWKDSCRVSTQANVNLAAPGATIDAVTMASGDRVLVRAQTAGAENGIYVWNGSAVPMTRAPDMNTAAEVEQACTTVEEGSSAGTTFRQTAVNVTLGTTPLAWALFGTSAPAASETTPGIAEIATQAETDAGTDDSRFVTPLKLANLAGRVRKFSQTFGDGTATQYTITHNLNSLDVQVEVYRNSGTNDSVLCDVERTSANAVRLTAAAAVAVNAFRCVVIG